jgi:hypothetical protein
MSFAATGPKYIGLLQRFKSIYLPYIVFLPSSINLRAAAAAAAAGISAAVLACCHSSSRGKKNRKG